MTSLTYEAIRSIHADHLQVDLVNNGDFGLGLAGWGATGWTGTTDATHTPGNTSPLYQTIAVTSGYTYTLVVTTTGITAGSVTPSIGTTFGTAITTNTTSVQTITAATNGTLAFTPTSAFDGTLDDISVVVVSSWSMDITASSLTEKWPTKKDTQVALDGTTETIYHRRDRVWDYASDLISRANLTAAYWYEMTDSINGGETFVFDPYGTIASPDNPVNAIMVGVPRFRSVGSLFARVSFTVREL